MIVARQHLARVRMKSSSSENSVRVSSIGSAAAAHLARAGVELEVGEADHVAARPPHRRAAQQRPNAREQLLQRERLRHVVVGAGVEPVDAVLDLVARRQHQHREALPARAQAPADLEPVHAGHQHVEDHASGCCRRLQPVERLAPVGRELDLVALQLERSAERLANRALIVDYEDLHAV